MACIPKLSFLVGVVCACAAAVVPAGAVAAVTVTVNRNPSSITASGGAMRISFLTTGKVVNCTTSRYTVTLASNAGPTPLVIGSNLQWSFGGPCTVTSGAGVTLSCTAGENFTVDGTTSVGGETPGSIGFDCTVAVTGSNCRVRITGGVLHTYRNNATSATDSIDLAGQTLLPNNSDDGSGSRPPRTCPLLPNDTRAQLTNSTGGALVLTVAPNTSITSV
jgi:hypothetical protein